MAAIYYLKGEIDSFNAKEFEDELLKFHEDNGELILDASQLEYMSSSGIRALIKLSRLQDEVRIDNVNDAVFSIFYSAGLTEIFTINREMLDLKDDGWEVAGVGASGTVYKIDDDTAIKVYKEGINFDYVNRERELARQAFISGVPTIIPNRNAKVNGQYATIFELVNSSSLGEMLTNNPDRFDELMDSYVDMIKSLHKLEDNKDYFPNLQDLWLKYEYMIREGLSKDDADLVVDLYKNSLRSKNLLHGDIHPGNVMISDGEMVLVDMASMSTGPDIFDVSSIYRLAMYGENVGLKDAAVETMGIEYEMFVPFWEAFAKRYYGVDDRDTIDKINKQLTAVAALDITFSINTIPPESARNYYKKVGSKVVDKIIRPNEDMIRRIMTSGKLDI